MRTLFERTRSAPRTGPVLAVLGIVVLSTAVAAMAATAHSATKPSNTSPPTIGGTMSEGSTLTVDHGNWDGAQPITFKYQWRRCDANGGSCSDISGAVQQTYVLKPVDNGNTLRVRVTATNGDGSAVVTSVPTAGVTATPQPAATGCPKTAAGAVVGVSDVSAPARLQIDQFQSTPGAIRGNMSSFSLRIHVGDTCGQTVSGADVYATAVPYNQVTVPGETATGSDGWVTLQFNRLKGFPAARKQELMVLFVRARKPGENPLAGTTTRRLISIPVSLRGF